MQAIYHEAGEAEMALHKAATQAIWHEAAAHAPPRPKRREGQRSQHPGKLPRRPPPKPPPTTIAPPPPILTPPPIEPPPLAPLTRAHSPPPARQPTSWLAVPPSPRTPPRSPPPFAAMRPSSLVAPSSQAAMPVEAYETVYEGAVRVALYTYNDLLVRRGEAELDDALERATSNSAPLLCIDGLAPLGTDAHAPPPRVLSYGSSAHYHLLRLSVDVGTAGAYRLPEGEALRRVRLLREPPPGEPACTYHAALGELEA